MQVFSQVDSDVFSNSEAIFISASEDLAFIIACIKASGAQFLPPSQTPSIVGGNRLVRQDSSDDENDVDDWTTAKTFEKRPASLSLPTIGRNSPRKVDELEDMGPTLASSEWRKQGNQAKQNENERVKIDVFSEGEATILHQEDGQTASRNKADGRAMPADLTLTSENSNDSSPRSKETEADASKRDEVLEQMAAIYWKERREHRMTKEMTEREIREYKARIEKLKEENEKLIQKVQDIELRELTILEKEKQLSLTPEEGERRKLEYLFERLLSVGNMVSEITQEIQLIKNK